MDEFGEIIIYQTDDGLSKIEVNLKNETVWLSIDQMAELFQRDRSVIGKHVRNIFKEGELVKDSVWAKFAYTAADGKVYDVDFYNLDVIISVGYRVKSIRGTQFRIWANSVLKEYIIKGFGNKEEYHKELLASMALNVGDEDLWKAYKAQFFEKDWPKACQDIFSRIKVGNYRIYPWYAAEERYDLMMEGLEACFYSDRLKQYEKKLKALYPERCLKLLVVDTNLMAEQSNKRADYRRVAKNLNWICRYPGGAEKAAQMADNYRIIYKQRRAMMEEIAFF